MAEVRLTSLQVAEELVTVAAGIREAVWEFMPYNLPDPLRTELEEVRERMWAIRDEIEGARP